MFKTEILLEVCSGTWEGLQDEEFAISQTFLPAAIRLVDSASLGCRARRI
jgi:hypothetical protein